MSYNRSDPSESKKQSKCFSALSNYAQGIAHALFVLVVSYCVLSVLGCRSNRDRGFDPYAEGVVEADLMALAVTNKIDEAWLKPSKDFYTLGPGDVVELEIMGDGETRTTTFIGPDGKLYFHFLPGLDVWGMTLGETKGLIEERLKQYYQSPHVSIILRQVSSKRVWILGRVNTSGVYPLSSPTTLLEGIGAAGGLFTSRFSGTTEELADLNHSFVMREGEILPVNFKKLLRDGDLSQNIYLKPGDFVYLPSSLSSEVYIMGAVRRPRAVGAKDSVTVISALAAAQGPLPNAYTQGALIVRGSLTEPQVARVNINDILAGRAKDIALQPRDILYIPQEPYRYLEKYANIVVNTFVRTIAANEGVNSVRADAEPVGVNIGIGN